MDWKHPDWSMPGLEFIEEGHIYRLNGKILPSVTTILSAEGFNNFGGASEALLANRAEFGKMSHLYTAYRDLGILDEGSIPEAIAPILESWELFKKTFKVEILMVEKPLASGKWGFACTPDRVAWVNGKMSVVEFKTTASIAKSVKWQLAGQQLCVEEALGIEIEDRWVVDIDIKGTMTTECYSKNTYIKDRAVITSALTCYRAKRGE
jgi:hypothetical protein